EWESLAGRISGERIDRRLFKAAPAVDLATGVDGLGNTLPQPPDPTALTALLAPPRDLGAWARKAAVEPVAPATALAAEPLVVSYPHRLGQRMETRMLVVLPAGARVEPAVEQTPQGTTRRELRLNVEGVVENERSLFDSFRMRFTVPPVEGGSAPLALAVPRPLRPGRYVVRLRVRDEVGGALAVVGGEIDVPWEPQPAANELLTVVTGSESPTDRLERELQAGDDALVLMVPPRDVVFDSIDALVVVKGTRIRKVTFLLDGQAQLSRNAPPWGTAIRLPRVPREQVLRAEGYDRAGQLVAADEVTLNQLKGQLEVSILAPTAKDRVVGATLARVQVVVPEERRVRALELRVNEQLQARLLHPPWQAKIQVPAGTLVYLTASAELDDDSHAEDTRILTAPAAMANVDVSLVELYTTVTDASGELVRGLSAADFAVREDGRQQELSRAELVEDLPLVVGVTLDVSGSMQQALGEAQRAAATFLQRLVRPRDRCFAVAFSDKPSLVMPRTPDAAAAAQALEGLRADGFTALNDALVFSLYYFQGTRGRRALVVLSDGADTNSRLGFAEALAYARDSGAIIYTVGLQTESLDVVARRRLAELATVTGGRAFVISKADELADVYERIEAELRSQYLLAYAPDRPASEKGFRRVEVKVARRGTTARTIPGYNP
ncbi:MAG TPA: VWA domain-containing protein, partial [Thermoanaerobaculia bacterium]|nr:VWA domain-containing protein [Thermoanaerobaculia bacterium]